MATLDYIHLPPGATRLLPLPHTPPSSPHPLRSLPKISTPLPNPSPPPTPPPLARRRTTSASSSLNLTSVPAPTAVPSSLTSPTLSFLPQLLLSSSLPSGVLAPKNGKGNGKPSLLSTRDPLSLPIMTSNFKRFVAKVGPVFWLQDRVEEVVLWKRGWRVTGVWMAGYAFFCYFPRMLLLLPHILLIAIILSTYRYPSPSTTSSSSPPPVTASTTEDWQANIQAIQNLMGFYADAHTMITPHLHLLNLAPLGVFSPPSQGSTATSQGGQGGKYTPHILTLLLLTLPPLAFLLSLPSFPMRTVALALGWGPLAFTHPWTRTLMPHLSSIWGHLRPKVVSAVNAVLEAHGRVRKYLGIRGVEERTFTMKHLKMALRRWVDDECLTDTVWNAEMRGVELWENERLAGDPGTWSKAHLKPTERGPWTRGRDGWSGMGVGGGIEEVDVQGEVSSNLTFSLAPGWAFVDTEDWRKDLDAAWVECGGDEDGWVYTNDAWIGPRPAPYTANGGSVTRRRRWMRRVFFDAGAVGVGVSVEVGEREKGEKGEGEERV